MNKIEGKRVLIVDPFLPAHDRSSGSLRLYRLMKIMQAEGHRVTFMPRVFLRGHEHIGEQLVEEGFELLIDPDGQHTPKSVMQTLREREFDLVIISFFTLAELFLPAIRACLPGSRVLIDTVDLHFVRERRQAALSGDASQMAKAEETYRSEIDTYSKADGLIAISELERQTLYHELPYAEIYVVPNVHDTQDSTPLYKARSGLVFVGNFWHPPNGEGIWWFCNTVWPELQRRVPSITLDIIGQDPPAELEQFANSQVRVHGWVKSTLPYLNSARLSIAPLLHGAGLKGKVGEALALGLPVVTTSIGAEGLGLVDSESAMIADDPASFVEAIVTAYNSPELWQRLVTNGRELIRRSYASDVVVDAVRKILPTPVSNAVAYFGVPDWNDVAMLQATLSSYFEGNRGLASTLHIGVYGVDIQAAHAQLVEIITGLGYDTDTIPDVTLTPLPSLVFDGLDPNLVWIPMRADIPKPAHLTSQANLAEPAWQS